MKLSEGPPSNRNTPTTDAKKIREKSHFLGGGPGLIFTQPLYKCYVKIELFPTKNVYKSYIYLTKDVWC